MTIEDQLKGMIRKKYKSIRAFTKTINIPYSTLDSIFKRGIQNAGVGTVLEIFNALELDVESIRHNKLSYRLKTIASQETEGLLEDEYTVLKKYRTLDRFGKSAVNTVLNHECERCAEMKAAAKSAHRNIPLSPDPKELTYDDDPKIHTLQIAGRDGSYAVYHLSERQLAEYQAKMELLPEATDI